MSRKVVTTRSFISRLCRRESSATVTNFYRNRRLRKNLKLYLEYVLAQPIDYLMIGEAPGYKGCRLTGVPFSSERLIRDSQHPQFVHLREALHIIGEQNENSASIIWEAIPHTHQPLIWNTFPYHPHNANDPKTNRKPNTAETLEGLSYVRDLIKLAQPKYILAIGRAAEHSLTKLEDIPAPVIAMRHPSYGGAAIYAQQMQDFLRATQYS